MTPQILLMKANEVIYQNPHWIQQIKHLASSSSTDQALLELLRTEDVDNMEIPHADVSFANSIVPILQLLPAKKTDSQK